MDIENILDREGLRIARDDKRILAFVVDDIIISILITAVFYNQIMALKGDLEGVRNLFSDMFLYITVIIILYQTIFTSMYGASIGKIICKIKIIKIDTLDKPNLFESFLRSFLRSVGCSLLYIPLLIAFATPLRRAMHDIFSKTIVIDVSIPQDIN